MIAIEVAAGVIARADGRVLIARRPDDKHAGGYWEFPGGKLKAGESAEAALRRELREELGIIAGILEPLISYPVAYPERTVTLQVMRVQTWSGEPVGMEGQPLQWVAIDALLEVGLLPADRPIVTALLQVPNDGG